MNDCPGKKTQRSLRRTIKHAAVNEVRPLPRKYVEPYDFEVERKHQTTLFLAGYHLSGYTVYHCFTIHIKNCVQIKVISNFNRRTVVYGFQDMENLFALKCLQTISSDVIIQCELKR